ncbi:MAG TPA: type II toxin-antitoxin system VapC family toxin [bacterium]|nr:type II toxin-antitoxin system VapC family toxin [bacterium]
MDQIYFDTSALAKWYINENDSETVEAFLREHGPVTISSLTSVEMRSLLTRRRKNRDFNPETEMRIWATFNEDIQRKHLVQLALSEDIFHTAINIIDMLPEISLRTLDALHLAICQSHDIKGIATADKIMADSASMLGMEVAMFGGIASSPNHR